MIKTAVIGAGYIAREHLDCLRSLPQVRTEAICDLSPVMAESTAEEFGVSRWFTDHREMLSQVKPDVVHITTPPRSHFPLAMDALEAGAHVIVEKPITFDADELQRLMDLAQARGLRLIEDHNYLFNSSVQQMLTSIQDGSFGDVVHVEVLFATDILGAGSKHAEAGDTNPFHALPGGAIADFVTHLAYLAHAFIGEHRAVQTSWRKRSDAAVPWDEFRALIDAERGTASVAFSAHSKPDVFWLRVHGTRMRASASLFEPLYTVEKLSNVARPLLPLLNGMRVARAYRRAAFGGLWRKLKGRPVTYEGLWELLRRFYLSVQNQGEAPISLRDVEGVHRLVSALLQEPKGP